MEAMTNYKGKIFSQKMQLTYAYLDCVILSPLIKDNDLAESSCSIIKQRYMLMVVLLQE